MYLLDTNVISEFRKIKSGNANQNVAEWASGIQAPSLFLSVITLFELEHGALLIERRDPRQGSMLRAWLNDHVAVVFADRILNVDVTIAKLAASLHVPDPRPERDALIAATALTHRMTMVTRDVTDFGRMGVEVLNPWEGETPIA